MFRTLGSLMVFRSKVVSKLKGRPSAFLSGMSAAFAIVEYGQGDMKRAGISLMVALFMALYPYLDLDNR